MKTKRKTSVRDIISALSTVILPFFKSEAKRKAWIMLLLLLIGLLVVNAINVGRSYVERDFVTALTAKQSDKFYRLILLYIGTLAGATVAAVLYRFVEEKLGMAWREWMTQHLLKKYFHKRAYYNLRLHEEIDNPDQRIAEDVKNVTSVTLSLFLILLNSIITVGAFVGVLATISWNLVIVLVAYAVSGTVFTFWLGRRLVRIHNRQYQREAAFRYGLIRVRENSESIAFFHGEPRERLGLVKSFQSVLRNTNYLIGWNRTLGFLTTGYNFLALVLPTIIVAPLYLSGKVEFGVVTQAAGAFSQVLAAMSVIITQFERMSSYTAGMFRLEALWRVLSAQTLKDEEEDPEIAIEEGNRLKLKELTVKPPKSKRVLVKKLDLNVRPGSGVLIMGESGSGKSSILRTIAGLWNSGEGTIQRPRFKEMMFLPQRPYMPLGNLRSVLMYPTRDSDISDEALKKILKRVNLDSVLKRTEGDLRVTLDWGAILSLGEQQRLSFARVLVRAPKLVFLDEATSALDEDNEKLLYEILEKDQLTFVSVGHRSTLKPFHNDLLTLEGSGKWSREAMKGKMTTAAT